MTPVQDAAGPAVQGADFGPVVFICDSDSQVFGTLGLARACQAAGMPVTYRLVGAQLPEAVRALLAPFAVETVSDAEAMSAERVKDFRAVGYFSHGSRIQNFRTWFARAFPDTSDRRPVLFTGFNGLILDKFEEGVAWRAGYDIVVVPGPRDVKAFAASFGQTRIGGQRIVACGLGHAQVVDRAPASGGRRKLVFAEQSVIPSGRADRIWLVTQLCRLARENPGWDVVVKVRVGPGDRTFHQVRSHLGDLLFAADPVPPNFSISSGSLARELVDADLMMTVSSTAVFEALKSGIPVVTVSDLGFNATLGTTVFVNSGLMMPLSGITSLDALEPRPANRAWLDEIGLNDGPDAFVAALRATVAAAAPLPPPFYGPGGEMPVPVRFAYTAIAGRAWSQFRDGNDEGLRKTLVAGRQLRPESLELRLLDDAVEGRIGRWTVRPRLWLDSAVSAMRWLANRLLRLVHR